MRLILSTLVMALVVVSAAWAGKGGGRGKLRKPGRWKLPGSGGASKTPGLSRAGWLIPRIGFLRYACFKHQTL